MIRHAIATARARRCYKVMSMSAAQRPAARAFYERLGFDREAKQAFVLNLREP